MQLSFHGFIEHGYTSLFLAALVERLGVPLLITPVIVAAGLLSATGQLDLLAVIAVVCKDRMYLRELATICLSPLRIAFDHIGLRKPYEQAIRFAHEFGLTELSNYMLYNFHDSPADLFERMRLNVALNEELDIRIWSFPMRFQPTDLPDRSYIGEDEVPVALDADHSPGDTRRRKRQPDVFQTGLRRFL